ncbi:Concanavalin A-like lectin/glucanase subgroup [Penicillium robsamsonii]|uniref:Concanavalin A-like lectin/glucanase subgroup n=1 Tax=Penicillium robsamsonii TaxID=1792511 RepID=UPI002548BF95|nr:Concanavalin A-like lectin/glucanase subgroup [Penicillium robsamsonii]KAJ5813240.1 Concanavalin A-like lectin/glucanase subgroup [Penicillium robsamsonii]
MLFYLYLCLLAYLPGVFSSSLLDFSAARGDNPSILGIRNLEAARGDTTSSNTDDLYIKLGADPNGIPSLHYHRIKGDIRAEYHSLSKKLASDQTYYIGYQFSLAEIEESLMVWQFKEYAANNAAAGGANIPLGLEFKGGQIHLQYQSSFTAKREHQWSQTLETNTVYSFGIVINTASPGWVELYFDGKKQTFSTSGTTRLAANTFPGRTEPKFGAYRGEAVGIDTYVYRVQIGTSLSDIKDAAGLATAPIPGGA